MHSSLLVVVLASFAHASLNLNEDLDDEAQVSFRNNKRKDYLGFFDGTKPRRKSGGRAEPDFGEKLFLSEFISKGGNGSEFKNSPDIWKELALVRDLSPIRSYSGYLTVNEDYGSNLFFWFFPAAYNPESAPVILWLNGGPGTSSLFGMFVENGPFFIDDAGHMQYRKNPWTLTHSVIYIDSPVGTGFSFTNFEEGYARTQEDVAQDLYAALLQFFTVFPEYIARDFYIAGQSYAGKYIPSISFKILRENSRRGSHLRINLRGVIIGSGFMDPYNQVEYGEYLYNLGLIDENEKVHFDNEEEKIKRYIRTQNWPLATQTVQNLILGSPDQRSYFENLTQFKFYMNLLKTTVPKPFKNYHSYLSKDFVRRAIHVGDQKFSRTKRAVLENLSQDICKSVRPAVETLLNANIRMLVYAPQLDIIVPHTGIDKFLHSLRWHGGREFAQAPRQVWRVKDDIAGYVKTSRNLVHVLLRNAGHLAAYDQPEWTFEMINKFTRGKPL